MSVVVDLAVVVAVVTVSLGMAQALAVLLRLHGRILAVEFELRAIKEMLAAMPRRRQDPANLD